MILLESVCFSCDFFIENSHPIFFSSVCFIDLPRSIIQISVVILPYYITYSMTSLIGITPHAVVLYLIEGIIPGKDTLRDDVVSKMIEESNVGHILGGFNQSQIRKCFQGVLYDIINEIGG